jgi:hypothetical protein
MIDQVFVFVGQLLEETFLVLLFVDRELVDLVGINDFQKPAFFMLHVCIIAILNIMIDPRLHSDKPVEFLADANNEFGLVIMHPLLFRLGIALEVADTLLGSALLYLRKCADSFRNLSYCGVLVTKCLKDLLSILVILSNLQELFLALIIEECLVLILCPIIPVVAG